MKWVRESTVGRLVRWALKLDEYDIHIEPRPGIKMPHVDALSRYPVAAISSHQMAIAPLDQLPAIESNIADDVPQKPSDLPSSIRWLQRQDEECQQLYQSVKRGIKTSPILQKYINQNRIQIKDSTIYYNTAKRSAVYTPQSLRERLLEEYHAGKSMAHLGSSKTLGALRRKYFWPSMKQDVFEYVHGCLDCLRRKGRQVPKGPRAKLPKGKPFQVVASDIYGPLPLTSKGNRFILVFIDHFTKWPVLIPARQITAEVFVQLFHDKWITYFECPKRLLTDGGPQFIAETTKEFCNKYNITHNISTAYHPQSNGIAKDL